MAEPVRTTHFPEPESDDAPTLQRWRRRRDGSMELLEFPLTPELFLDPQIGDTMVQGGPHSLAVHDLFERLLRWASRHPDVLIQSDVKHLLGPGLSRPVPDISVVRGLADPGRSFTSYNVAKEGVPPCLVIEVVSPTSARIRNVDEKDKVQHYQRAGIAEYLLLDLPRLGNLHCFGFRGYRLDAAGLYRPLEPDSRGHLLSEATRLRFGVSSDGQRISILDDETGEPLLSGQEVTRWAEAAAKRAEAAEDRAEAAAKRAEAAAKLAEAAAKLAEAAEDRAEAAESEVERLRAEVERLRSGS